MKKINRREFLLYTSATIFSMPLCANAFIDISYQNSKKSGKADIKGSVFKNDGPKNLWKWSHEAFSYKKLKDKKVVCGNCPYHCVLSPGDRSICRSKVNIDGKLYSLTYGNPCAVHIDPVEKKPLYHFKPMTKVFSIATTGCNFRCLNCQNWEISQAKPETVRFYEFSPQDIIDQAKKKNTTAIAYTYSEPVTFFEYMIDIATIAKNNNLSNLWISNGYINKKPLLELCKFIDGANVNLKAYSDEIYRKLNGGRLGPVLNTFKTMHQQKVHFEMTNLVVPGYTDDQEMVKKMCDWILNNLGPDYPLHFLRFFPKYKLDKLAPTPISTLTKFREIAMSQGIHYVYTGNLPIDEGNNTYCHKCKKLLIQRKGYFIQEYNLNQNRCKFCDTTIPGVWS